MRKVHDRSALFRERSFLLAFAGALLIAPTTFAQDAAQDAAEDAAEDDAGVPEGDITLEAPVEAAPLEVMAEAPIEAAAEAPQEMVVTGSRIRRKDLAGPAPVVVFSRDKIQASGRATVAEFLQTIPEQSNAPTRGHNNGGEGAMRVNLRGLGEWSTLVLLNGRRLGAGGLGADDAVDMSAIPSNMIERIEVLKDGASAVYGSDAIAGVVNIITRKRFDRAEVNAYGGTATRGDGQLIDADALVGSSNVHRRLLQHPRDATHRSDRRGDDPAGLLSRGLRRCAAIL